MSEATLNLYLQHQVNIAQYSRSEVEEALKNLQRLQDDIKARIAGTTEYGSLSKTRLQGELAAITKLMQDGYEAIGDDYRQGQDDSLMKNLNGKARRFPEFMKKTLLLYLSGRLAAAIDLMSLREKHLTGISLILANAIAVTFASLFLTVLLLVEQIVKSLIRLRHRYA